MTPENEELERKKATLSGLQAKLADRELELASISADLAHFEGDYLRQVGRRYAILDELKAELVEVQSRKYPRNQDVHAQARQARLNAQDSAQALGEQPPGSPPSDNGGSGSKPLRSESLRSLYRQAARLLHPDLTLDGDERQARCGLMAQINDAYRSGDEERIRSIVSDWHASPENVQGDGPGIDLVRVIRKIAQVEKRLRGIAANLDQIRRGDLFKLKQAVNEAQAKGQDILGELAERLETEIADLHNKLTEERRG